MDRAMNPAREAIVRNIGSESILSEAFCEPVEAARISANLRAKIRAFPEGAGIVLPALL